ncbi:hypothetical protein G6F26_004478 [Rhizopus arrhizus]|nr:hypothetical protein G6F28_005502 [Rhizopus arrhizus]KAG1026205.1 hypothetical protein G6F26_004478 [Rhizopus arrhizus]KAG1335662.1 hypothetical protein G6F63_010016 [Rhizopus arrhizus]KAG1414572.1 hypothetical protein G6F59_010198 [Rhizopus arrhizus]
MSSNVSFIQPAWSDHFLVTSYFALRAPVHSTVLEAFRNLVSSTIANTMISFDLSLPLQEKWDMVKSAIAQVAKLFSRRSVFNLTKALRAGNRWKEQDEISAGYLKRTVSQRQTRQIMKQLVHPTTGALCSTSNEMLDAAVQFYSNLYSSELIDSPAIDDLLSAIPDSLRLSDSNQRFLTNSFTYDDLIEEVSRCPCRSSPGLDGSPYEILRLIFIHPASKGLVLQTQLDYYLIKRKRTIECILLIYVKSSITLASPINHSELINPILQYRFTYQHNEFLSSPVLQYRGLRQGDPISPVFFNLAFKPLLRRILSDPHFSGFQLPNSVCSPTRTFNLLSEIVSHHLHLYSMASNAKVNFNKTEAFALSGSRSCYHRIWRTPLMQQQIHFWHDSSSSQPIIYLGFPLHSSIAQRDAYLTSLLFRLETSLQLRSCRSLLFRGRITILNSRFSPNYGMSYVPFLCQKGSFSGYNRKFLASSQQNKLHALALKQCAFLEIKGAWVSLTHHYNKFWNCRSLKSSVVLPLLVDFLLSHLMPTESQEAIQTDYRQAFVFKQLRPRKLVQSLDGVFSLFFRAVDNLSHTFDKVVINPQTALCLTLDDVSVPSSSCPLPNSMARLSCSSVYMTDPISGRLRPTSSSEISLHPYLTKRFLKWVRSDHMKLYSFFIRAFLRPSSSFIPVAHTHIDMSPFLVALSLIPKPGDQLRLTSKRLTHNKLPCRSNLYLPFKLCPICKNSEEIPSHFLFDCPQKLAVWSPLWDSQFEQQFSIYSLYRALFLLDFPKCRSDMVHAPSVFLGTILLAIWRNHWAVIFDNRPFLTDVTIRYTYQLLSVSLQESLLSSGISSLPLPHL